MFLYTRHAEPHALGRFKSREKRVKVARCTLLAARLSTIDSLSIVARSIDRRSSCGLVAGSMSRTKT